MSLICLNLIDGTSVIGKELKSDNRDFIKVNEPLLVSSSNYSITGSTQILLTKYNIFGDESFVLFNFHTIISKTRASKLMEQYYDRFITNLKNSKAVVDNLKTSKLEEKPADKHAINPLKKEIDIEDLRNNVMRINEMAEEDNEDLEYQLTLNDDDEEEDDD